MVTILIQDWSAERAWTDWSGQARHQLVQRLKAACPALGVTDRKRLARAVLKRQVFSIELPSVRNAAGIRHVLESLGASVTIEGGRLA
jgi:hypothetical protein